MDQPDHHEIPESDAPMSIFLPYLLMAAAILILLGGQFSAVSAQRAQLQTALIQQEPQLQQARQLQASLEGIAGDLLKLSATDADARAIVSRFGISAAPGPGEAAPR